MKKYYIYIVTILLLVVVIVLFSNFLLPKFSYARNVDGIDVPRFMFNPQDSQRIDEDMYCTLLEDALHYDSISLKKFVTLDKMIDGEAGYCHGIIIVELIERVGEDFFIESLNTISLDKKKDILAYIRVGIAYRHAEIDDRTPKEVFPKVSLFLNQGDRRFR